MSSRLLGKSLRFHWFCPPLALLPRVLLWSSLRLQQPRARRPRVLPSPAMLLRGVTALLLGFLNDFILAVLAVVLHGRALSFPVL